MSARLPFLLSLALIVSLLAEAPALEPLLVVPDEVLRSSDFSKAEQGAKSLWSRRQHTRWEVAEGMFVGIPSTAEFQAQAKDHKGLEPRTSTDAPADLAMRFSVRFSEGEETSVVPFIEFTHHICRLKFQAEGGLILITQGETLQVAEAADFKFQSGAWYHALAERRGDEFVIQFADGPTLYAKHPSIAPTEARPGGEVGFAGPRGGRCEIDNVTIWSIKPEATQPGWAKAKAGLFTSEPRETPKVEQLKKRAEWAARKAAREAAAKRETK